MMSTHEILSPSKRHRWSKCPGSPREEAKYPDDPSGPAAIDGTHTHTVLEYCVKESCHGPEIGLKLSDHEGEFEVDEVRAERVRFALDYIYKRRTELNGALYAETRVDPMPILNRSDMAGTVDVRIESPEMVEIIDYKDGMGYVKAEGNEQLEQYAYGVIAQMLLSGNLIDKMRLTIIQPKLRVKGHPGIESWDVSALDLLARKQVIIDQANATDDPNAPLIAGDHCGFCKHSGCAARAQQAMSDAGVSFEDLTKQAAEKQPGQMTDEQLRSIVEAAPLIRQMIEGAEIEAMRRFEAGHPVIGLKVVRGRGSRSWAFDEEEMATKLKRMGLPKDVLWKTSLITPAQAEKVTWTKRSGEVVQLSARQLKTLQTEYITKSDGKLTVVPESDERASVQIGVPAGMFQPVVTVELPDWLK